MRAGSEGLEDHLSEEVEELCVQCRSDTATQNFRGFHLCDGCYNWISKKHNFDLELIGDGVTSSAISRWERGHLLA